MKTSETISPQNTNINGPLFLLGLFTLFLIILAISVNSHGWLTSLNEPLTLALRQLRSESLDKAMVLFTLLAERPVIICLFTVVAAYLALTRYWGALGIWILNMTVVIGLAFFLRMVVTSPRPDLIAHIRSANSFPSGHMTLTIGVLGLLVLFILQHTAKSKSRWVWLGFIFFSLLMAATRLTLCAHWLTDILGSISLGIISLSLVTFTYRSAPCKLPALQPTLLVGLCGWLLGWSWYVGMHFSQQVANYSLLPVSP
jgi:membrane-associated phospholipid phosphatase